MQKIHCFKRKQCIGLAGPWTCRMLVRNIDSRNNPEQHPRSNYIHTRKITARKYTLAMHTRLAYLQCLSYVL